MCKLSMDGSPGEGLLVQTPNQIEDERGRGLYPYYCLSTALMKTCFLHKVRTVHCMQGNVMATPMLAHALCQAPAHENL